MTVKNFKEFGESAKGLSSEAREATELAWFALGYPAGDRRRDLREAVYARVLREFAQAVGGAEREELMRLASSPSGGALVFGLIELLELRAAVEEGDPLFAARRRGLEAKKEILRAEGGTLGTKEVAALLGMSDQGVRRRLEVGKLLALTLGRRGYRYPLWQFDEQSEGGVLSGFEEVLENFSVDDPWMRADFMLSGEARLGGQRPLDALREGRVEAVKEAARAYGEHGAE